METKENRTMKELGTLGVGREDATRQWNEDEGIDLASRLGEKIQDILADEAEAIGNYADLKETMGDLLDEDDISKVDAIISHEKLHQKVLRTMADKYDGIQEAPEDILIDMEEE